MFQAGALGFAVLLGHIWNLIPERRLQGSRTGAQQEPATAAVTDLAGVRRQESPAELEHERFEPMGVEDGLKQLLAV